MGGRSRFSTLSICHCGISGLQRKSGFGRQRASSGRPWRWRLFARSMTRSDFWRDIAAPRGGRLARLIRRNLDRRSWTSATAAAPSPIAPPTRFTDPERASPTAYTPRTLDSSATGARRSAVWTDAPVTTKPCASSKTPQPRSHSVSGSAPANTHRLRTWFAVSAPEDMDASLPAHQHRVARANQVLPIPMG
jgi:hypothetical protein